MKKISALKRSHIALLVVGLLLDLVELGCLLLWILRGVWIPFAVCMPLVLLTAWLLVRYYYRCVAYICPECKQKFKPTLREFFFSNHTLVARKLTCTICGFHGWCVETEAEGLHHVV